MTVVEWATGLEYFLQGPWATSGMVIPVAVFEGILEEAKRTSTRVPNIRGGQFDHALNLRRASLTMHSIFGFWGGRSSQSSGFQ